LKNLFIDTNVFLSFYHFSNDDLEELNKLVVLLESKDIILWLPQQVKDEFHRNRENKISDSMKKIREQKFKPQFPQICKDYEEYSEIRELTDTYKEKLSSLIDKADADTNSKTLKADLKIKKLFEKSKIIDTTQSLVDKAMLRVTIGNPPGKDGSTGDAINWEALLENINDEQDLYIVADDQDYYSKLDNEQLKDFLKDEWTEKKSTDIIFFRRLSQFFKEYYPHIKFAIELEREHAVKDLINSNTFATTHRAIAKLDEFSEFTKSEVNELMQVTLSNSQISSIIRDTDVDNFYTKLYNANTELIDEEIKEKIFERFGTTT